MTQVSKHSVNKSEVQEQSPKKKRVRLRILIVLPLVGLGGYFCLGFFVIQPIGAVPDGATVLYWRLGTNMGFISSADGILLDNGKGVSILGRAVVMGTVAEQLEGRRLVTLPYSETMYLWSTGGREFVR